MCYHVSTPAKEKYDAYLAEYKVENAAFHYFANGFAPSILPVTTNKDNRRIYNAIWGYINPHADSLQEGKSEATKGYNLNVRDDSVFKRFPRLIAHQRCLMWVDGFYEFQHRQHELPTRTGRIKTEVEKVPYYIYMPEHVPFSIAGIYSYWHNPENGQMLTTVCMLTTDANVLLSKIHNSAKRMPVIIPPGDRDKWLSDIKKEDITELLQPYSGEMAAHTVLKSLVLVKANSPDTQEEYNYE